MKLGSMVVFCLIFIAIGLLIFDIITLRSEGSQCINDPLVYGAKELTELNGYEFSCTCGLLTVDSPIIYFDQYGMNVTFMHTETDYQFVFNESMFINE